MQQSVKVCFWLIEINVSLNVSLACRMGARDVDLLQVPPWHLFSLRSVCLTLVLKSSLYFPGFRNMDEAMSQFWQDTVACKHLIHVSEDCLLVENIVPETRHLKKWLKTKLPERLFSKIAEKLTLGIGKLFFFFLLFLFSFSCGILFLFRLWL